MRKILLILVAAFLSLSATMYAYDFSATVDGQTLYFNVTDAGNQYCEVTEETGSGYSSTKPMGELTIPATVVNPNDGLTYTIVGLGSYAFEYCSQLTKVNLPQAATFTYIGRNAFYAAGLETITIPDNVTTLGQTCFRGTKIKEIKPEMIGAGLTTMTDAFYDCDYLEHVVLPNTVTQLDETAFAACGSLKYIELGNAVTNVESSAFGSNRNYSYPSAIDTIVLNTTTPPAVDLYMGIDEFYDALVNRCLLFVPSGTVDAYKADAHWGLFKYIFAQGTEVQLYTMTVNNHSTSSLDNATVLINGVAFRDNGIFKGLAGEEFEVEVTFGNPYFGIDKAMLGETDVTNLFVDNKATLEIPEGGATLDLTYTLKGQPYDFTEMIPSGQQLYFTITDNVNKKVKIVNQTGGRSVWGSVSAAYLAEMYRPKGDMIIPTTVTHEDVTYTIEEIDTLAFRGCGDLTSVTFTEGLKTIRAAAFEDCWSLTDTMSIPESCTIVEEQAFRDCDLKAYYPGGSLAIEQYVLLDNPVKIIKASPHTEQIGMYLIRESTLEVFELGENVNFVSSYAFADCSGLTKVVCYATTPPAVRYSYNSSSPETSWRSYDASGAKLYVPKGCKATYEAADCWKDFGEIIEMATTYMITTTTSGGVGRVDGGGRHEENTSVELTAVPAPHYEFVQWSDGNTANPRTITVTGDATYTAVFGPRVTRVGDILSINGTGTEVRYQVTSVSPNEVKLIANGNYYREFSGEWTIPSVVTDFWGEEFQLTRLAEYCLYDNRTVTILHIPEGVRVVESSALYASYFEELYFPSTIDSIGENASSLNDLRDIHFAGIENLRAVDMYDYSTGCPLWLNAEENAFCVKDGVALFYRGEVGDKLEVPEGVKVVAKWVCFRSYTNNLHELRLPASLKILSTEAFRALNNRLTVHVQSPTPPAVMDGDLPFSYENNTSMFLRVDCSADYDAYAAHPYWGSAWTNISTGSKYFYTVSSDNIALGTIQATEPTCGTIHLVATPKSAYYQFDRWSTGATDATIDVVLTKDTVITAYFKDATFLVRYIDWDGSVLSEQYVTYNSNAIPPSNPSREGYDFLGWSSTGQYITANTDITATYRIKKFVIRFENEAGGLLQSVEVEYGQTPVYTNPTPTKAADNTYTYTFTGWTPEIVPATAAATYTTVFSKTYREYDVRFYNWNDDLLDEQSLHYGDAITYKGVAPERPSDETYKYTFSGWSNGFENGVTTVTGNMEFLAEFDQDWVLYTATFFNYDATILQQKDDYHYNAVLYYNGEEPSRPSTNTIVYTFTGWDNGFENGVTRITKHCSFSAVYESAIRYYKVWFASCETCDFVGSADVMYEGDATSQAPTAEYMNETFAPEGKEFDRWSSDITSITEDELVVWPIWKEKLPEITEVRVTFEAPAVGQSTYKGEGYIVPEDPNFNVIGRVSVPEGANYEVSGYFFDLTPWDAIDDETFQTGKQYSVEIDLLPKEGYTFPHDGFFVDANQVDILINGAAPANTGGNDVELSVYAYFIPQEVPTAIEEPNDGTKAVKIIRDNQLYIIRDGKTYNAQGEKVE